LHKPKPLPETAKDVYGVVGNKEHASDAKEETTTDSKKKPPKELPGEALPEYVGENKPDEKTSESKKQSETVKEPPAIKQASDNSVKKGLYTGDEGFFSDFDRFLKNKDMNERFISELMDKDLLHKMKQFHTQREEGMPFFFHAGDSDRELESKMAELQRLEEEWYLRHKEYKETEVLLLEKEAEIDLRLEELKNILKHMKQREKLERKAKKNNYFHLGDGRVLRSVGDLREALRGMKDSLFKFHVSEEKNDFSEWVRHVFRDEELAERIASAKSRKELLKVLLDF